MTEEETLIERIKSIALSKIPVAEIPNMLKCKTRKQLIIFLEQFK